MSDDELVVEQRGQVLVARLNRPDARNALTATLMAAIARTALAAEADTGVRVLVLTGTGERAFCAGMDLRSFAGGAPDVDRADMEAYFRLLRGQLTVPVVGAANGTAVGGGLELLLGCDVIVASSAARFGFPEVQRGLFPAGDGTRVGRRLPPAVALEMTLTGEPIDAARAYAVGLVNAVVEPADVLTAALAIADRIAANAPLALAAIKELVQLGVDDPTAWATRLEAWQSVVFTSEDAKEGATAFLERRPPVWRGR